MEVPMIVATVISVILAFLSFLAARAIAVETDANSKKPSGSCVNLAGIETEDIVTDPLKKAA